MPPSHTTRRALRRIGRALLICALALPGVARAEDDDPPPEPPRPVVLSTVSTDPIGDASLLASRARTASDQGRLAAAFDALVRVAERHADVLLPVSAFVDQEDGGALRWRAREGANLALARLPDPWPRELLARWGAASGALLERGRGGDHAALKRLARDFGALPDGAQALLLLADADFETGRFVLAARGFQRWLLLRPAASPASRAAVTARFADALRHVDDAGGLERLAESAAPLHGEPVVVGNQQTTLGDHLAQPRTPPDVLPETGRADLPDELVLLWSLDMDDPSWLRPNWDDAERHLDVISAGAHVDDEMCVIHGGRVVRRLDPATGVEFWRFPHVTAAPIPSPDARYAPHDIPHRTVTRAGDLLLCVMGEPGATGSYTFLDETVDAGDMNQELRMRLVALDAETGALRWWTGSADETHPVLGDRATGCASPPLVVGDLVYCLFARRLGVGDFHLACLDLASGRPLWVHRLASAESGRTEDRHKQERFGDSWLHALPWGARPAWADGEVLALPHAGFAAGVDAASGSVRWLRALPRYRFDAYQEMPLGHAPQNEPVAWGDTWILAPLDSPRLLCIERGSGVLRWDTGNPVDPEDHPPWRHMYGVDLDPEGRPAIHLADALPVLVDARDPSRALLNGVERDGLEPYGLLGRGLVTGRVLIRVGGRMLDATPIDAGPDDPVPEPVPLPDLAPSSASVFRSKDVYILIGDRYAAAVAAPDAGGVASVGAAPTDRDRARGAVAGAMRARIANRPDRMDAAFDRAATITGPALRDAAYRRLAEELEVELFALLEAARDPRLALGAAPATETLAALVVRLPVDLRGRAFSFAAEALVSLGRADAAMTLLEQWIAEPGDGLVPYPIPDPRFSSGADVRLRGDLAAAAFLDRIRGRTVFQGRLAERERVQNERVTAVVEADESRLREAIRRAVGTSAAAVGRQRLRERLADAGRVAEAAAVDADLRLDPAPLERRNATRLLRSLARLQLREAEALAATLELRRARSLLNDLSRWAPGGTRDVRGRSVAHVAADVVARQARKPQYQPNPPQLDLWHGLGAPVEREQISSVRVLPVSGPGADQLGPLVPVARGLTFEMWARSRRGRVMSLPGTDEGWFGGSLHAVDRWVPGGGVLVSSVVAGEPADRSTVRAGDWITSWNGTPVPDLSSFMRAVAAARPGETIDIEVYRNGEQILDRFRAGRRPIEQRANLLYAPLYAASDGRLLLPGRIGLTWVDPKKQTRESLWEWTEAGVVQRVHVFGGEAFALIQRNLRPDLVLKLDLTTGRELWRAQVTGSIGRVQASGSALWVDAVAPQGAFVIDRHDGSLRAAYRAVPVTRPELRRTWTPAWTADVGAHGRGFVACRDSAAPRLRCVNTTTGRSEWSQAWDADDVMQVPGPPYIDPYVSADAVFSVVQGPHALMLGVADPLGEADRPQRQVVVGPKHLRTDSGHGGPLSTDARVHVVGNTIHVVRNTRRRAVTVWTLAMDFGALRGATGAGEDDPDFVTKVVDKRILGDPPPGASQWPYVLHIDADFDGVYVTGATLANEPYVEIWYVSQFGTQHLLMQTVNEARRHAPVRVGEFLYVPTDRGAVILPLEPIER